MISDFTCPICGYRTDYNPWAEKHWQMHQKDPQELRDLLAKMAEAKKGPR